MKGMNDLFSDELRLRRYVIGKASETFERFGFSEIQTPVLEELSLFLRSVGESSDIVTKEMYALEDRDGTKICMRPEGTAGVVRALVEHHKVSTDQEAKVYYVGSMFRRERPQRGRLREFSQIGAEFLGVSEPTADVEVLAMLHTWLSSLQLGELTLLINSLGQPDERAGYLQALRDYYTPLTSQLCADCQRRLTQNVLRLLDCKNPNCSALADKAPSILEFLGEDSKLHFEQVKSGLKQLGIEFKVSSRLVRGLDYYTRTVFEFVAESGLGAQNTVAAGGRYDNLVAELGGSSTPAFGFAAGVERLVLLLEENSFKLPESRPDFSLVYADDLGKSKVFELAQAWRLKGLWIDFEHKTKSVKAQMRRADRMRCKEVIVIGAREVESGEGQAKMLDSGEIRVCRIS